VDPSGEADFWGVWLTNPEFLPTAPDLVAGANPPRPNRVRTQLLFILIIPPVMTDQLRSKIIDENPIGKGLDAFRASFNSICKGARISCTPDALEQLGQEGKQDTTTS
jgi:hypothetical protein